MPELSNKDDVNAEESLVKKPDRFMLSKEEYIRLGNVRWKLWLSSLHGGLYGSTLGLAGSYFVIKYRPALLNVKKLTTPIKRNYLVSSFLLGGVMGMIIGATVQGKNSFPYIRDIILFNTKPATNYSGHLINNEKESTSIDTFIRRQQAIEDMKLKKKLEEEDIKKRSF